MSFIFDNNHKLTYGMRWLCISLFCAIFSMIYEHFSFGVISYSMVFLFAIPLVLGAIPCMILQLYNLEMPNRLYQDGVMTLTLMALVNGILEIYGTTSHFIYIYFIAGILLLLVGIILQIFAQKS